MRAQPETMLYGMSLPHFHEQVTMFELNVRSHGRDPIGALCRASVEIARTLELSLSLDEAPKWATSIDPEVSIAGG